MTPHELAIYNMALNNIGVTRIPSLDYEGERKNLCESNYDRAVTYVTGLYNWNCTQKRAVLSPLREAPPFGFSSQFVLPSDCVRLERIEGLTTGEYTIEGRKILADSGELQIVYSKKIDDPTEFSPHVFELVSYALAAYVAPTLKSIEEGNLAMQKITQSLGTAISIDSDQVTNNVDEVDPWIEAIE